MKNLLLRSLTGAVYVALITAGILVNEWSILALCCLFVALAQIEFYKLTRHADARYNYWVCAVDTVGALMLVGGSCMMQFMVMLTLLMGFVVYLIVRLVMQIYLSKTVALSDLAYSLMSQIYISLPLALLPWIDPHVAMAMFVFIWLNDTGAFLVGCTFGKHPLFPRISPKKSWEGFWGGMIFCILASVAYSIFCPDYTAGLSLGAVIGMGILVSVVSTWGDLVESMIKRTLQVKDSGHILPGHGGILDRIDSLLPVVPAVTVYLYVVFLLG